MLLLKGTSEQALLDLINDNNDLPVPIGVGDLYYGNPKSIDNGYTRLPTVTQYDNEEYEGYGTFEYKRINLSIVFKNIRPIIREVGQNSLARLLPVVNKKTGMNLQPSDIIDQSVTWLGGNEQANLQFVVSPKSLGYEGRFVIQFIRVRPTLTEVVKTKTVPVLKFPDPVIDGKQSLSMASWGIDWTDDQSLLRIANGGWALGTPVVTRLAELGFPNIPMPNNLVLYATKDVPQANKAFSHVIIQRGIVTSTHNGDLYFHFNRS